MSSICLLFASKIFFNLSLKVFKLIDVKSFTLNVQLLVGFSFCRVERIKVAVENWQQTKLFKSWNIHFHSLLWVCSISYKCSQWSRSQSHLPSARAACAPCGCQCGRRAGRGCCRTPLSADCEDFGNICLLMSSAPLDSCSYNYFFRLKFTFTFS